MAEEMIFENIFKRLLAICVFSVVYKEIVLVTCETSGKMIVPVHYMTPGMSTIKQQATDSKLEVYCFRGCNKSVVYMFSTVVFQFRKHAGTNGYKYYQGFSSDEVLDKYEEQESSWSLSANFFSHLSDSEALVLQTFNQECVGIKTSAGYSVVVNIVSVDLYKVGFLCCGILFFFLAPRLSHNEVFFYVCGTLIGICSSLLIVVYFVSKLIPKKTLMVGAILSSWSISFFMFKYLLENFQYVLKAYFYYVFSYVIAAGFISFALCYRMGLPTNPRSKNLIQWMLQGCSLGLMWFSSSHNELKCVIIFMVLLLYKCSSVMGARLKSYWIHRFPPKQEFLSEEEFIEQGAKETQKALESLRQHCKSPECNQWETVLHVKNPRRFAEFMNGSPHVTNEELLAYEHHSRSIQDDIFTDDSSESDQEEFPENKSHFNEILK